MDQGRVDASAGRGGSAPEYGIVVAQDVMVPMRDGVRLATDVYWPARDGEPVAGRFPAILGRTSYDKTTRSMWVEPVATYFARRGYVVVVQDLRGRHRSEGAGQYFHVANVNEGPDGHDTVEWIAGQPWSNGRVGTVGSSHGAIVQQVLALHRPPHLAAMWADVGPTNAYAHEAREGGAMCLNMLGALLLHAHDAQEIAGDPVGYRIVEKGMEELRDWVTRMPWREGATPLAPVPNLERTLFEYLRRGDYDDYWAHEALDQERHLARHADVPGVYSGGWYDQFAIGTTVYYATLARQSRTPQRLIMGPWTHGAMRGRGSSVVGDVDFGPDAAWGDAVYNRERLRWFDRWLKDRPTGVDEDPPVRIFVMGGGDGRRTRDGRLAHGGRWRAEHEWPLARTHDAPYYLRADGGLSTEAPPAGAPPLGYAFDPAHPVPTVGGNLVAFFEMAPLVEGMNPAYMDPRARMRSIVPDGPRHQAETPGLIGARYPDPNVRAPRPLALRPDVLVFRTPPLEAPLEVTGPIQVHLWISSSAVDTDFTAKLIDVYPPSADYPDGYHMNLVDSIIRCRYRDSWERGVPMTPGEVYHVAIALPPTSNLFAAGHRIRLDVSSSNFPRYDVNPNTGEPLGRHTYQVVARNRVYVDRDHPSHVVLPVIPG